MKISFIFFLLLLYLNSLLSDLKSQEIIDENSLFSEETSIISSETFKNTNIIKETEKNTHTLSGTIYNINNFYIIKDSISSNDTIDDKTFTSKIRMDLFFDIRLRQDAKAFINLELSNSPGNYVVSGSTDLINSIAVNSLLNNISIKEFFIDSSINNKLYYRIGKQFLQWGRTFFWNPTDLINIERKNFLDLSRPRAGSYGLRLHIPFGTKVNIYNFIDSKNVNELDQFAVSIKFEFLIKNTEIAFSAWNKKNQTSIFGFDFSSRLFQVDLYGEMSLSYGENKYKLDTVTLTQYKPRNEWISKYSIGLSKSFDWELKDRITTSFEFYSNSNGYSENIFNDPIKRKVLFDNNLYEPNNQGVYYAAFFSSINKFMTSNFTLNFNTLGNLSDNSFITTLGLNYNPFYDFIIGFNINGYLGDKNSEYTWSGNKLMTELRLTLSF